MPAPSSELSLGVAYRSVAAEPVERGPVESCRENPEIRFEALVARESRAGSGSLHRLREWVPVDQGQDIHLDHLLGPPGKAQDTGWAGLG